MRALLVGGIAHGEVREVGDPAPEHLRVEGDAPPIYLPDHMPTIAPAQDRDYHRRDFAVELGGEVRQFVVYLAGAELVGWATDHLRPHLVRHVTLELDRAGLIDLPRDPVAPDVTP